MPKYEVVEGGCRDAQYTDAGQVGVRAFDNERKCI